MPRNPIFFVLLLAGLLVLPGLGNRDFSTRGEPREALVAQSIAEGGIPKGGIPDGGVSRTNSWWHHDWVLGTGYGGSVPSKPPLTHWITALISAPLGEVTPATARLPSAIAGILAVVLFASFVARRYGSSRGALTGILLLTSIEWFRASFTARVDMMLAATLTGGLVALFQWEERGRTTAPWCAMVMFSLAALTKGPVAIVLPGIIFVMLLLQKREPIPQIIKSGLLLFLPVLFVVAMWYVAAFLERRDAFLDKIWYENVQRFMGTQEDEPHKSSVLYLWSSLAIGLLPWSLLLVWRLRPLLGSLNMLRSPALIFSGLREWFGKRDSFERYAFTVLLAFLIFFAIPGSKRSVYLLPAYPFAAFLLSGLLVARSEYWVRAPAFLARTLGGLVFLLAALLAVVITSPQILLSRLQGKRSFTDIAFYVESYRAYFSDAPLWAWSLVGLFGVLVVLVTFSSASWGQYFKRAWEVPSLPLAVLVCSLFGLGNAVLFPPAVNGLSSRDLAVAFPLVLRPNEKVYSFATEFYGVSFYSKTPIYRFEEQAPTSGLLILNEDDLKDFEDSAGKNLRVTPLLRSAAPITRPQDYVIVARMEPRD